MTHRWTPQNKCVRCGLRRKRVRFKGKQRYEYTFGDTFWTPLRPDCPKP